MQLTSVSVSWRYSAYQCENRYRRAFRHSDSGFVIIFAIWGVWGKLPRRVNFFCSSELRITISDLTPPPKSVTGNNTQRVHQICFVSDAEVALKHFNELLNDLPQTYREFDALQQRFTANKLQNLIASLQKCDQSNNSSNNKKKAELCFAARHALLALVTPEHSHEVSEQQRQMQLVGNFI